MACPENINDTEIELQGAGNEVAVIVLPVASLKFAIFWRLTAIESEAGQVEPPSPSPSSPLPLPPPPALQPSPLPQP